MNLIELEAFAKINIGLDVIRKRPDNYHDIITIMQEVDLRDRLTVEKIREGIIIESNKDEVPKGRDNLVYQVWEKMREKYALDGGVKFYIEKNIPIAGGLAGGSTNAAAALRGINELWNLNLSTGDLEKIGASLGADIPFCLRGGTLLARGIGDEFEEINSFKNVDILLVNPNIKISTREVYEGLNLGPSRKNFKEIVTSVNKKDLNNLGEKLYNKLEENVVLKYPEINNIKEIMLNYNANGALMSGSGSTVFGIFKNKGDLHRCGEKIRSKFKDYIVLETKTL